MSAITIQEEITGGESVYCINQAQMSKTSRLMEAKNESGTKLRATMLELEKTMDRNELAALSFALIEKLNAPTV